MKSVYILRAVPGAGKSTVADEIHEAMTKSGRTALICCADDFHIDLDGNYNWSIDTVGHGHLWCKREFEEALQEGIDCIIVSNTNVITKDVTHYRNLAIEHGYMVFVLVVENWHNGKDVHNVPDEIKVKMKDQLVNSMRLFPNPINEN